MRCSKVVWHSACMWSTYQLRDLGCFGGVRGKENVSGLSASVMGWNRRLQIEVSLLKVSRTSYFRPDKRAVERSFWKSVMPVTKKVRNGFSRLLSTKMRCFICIRIFQIFRSMQLQLQILQSLSFDFRCNIWWLRQPSHYKLTSSSCAPHTDSIISFSLIRRVIDCSLFFLRNLLSETHLSVRTEHTSRF